MFSHNRERMGGIKRRRVMFRRVRQVVAPVRCQTTLRRYVWSIQENLVKFGLVVLDICERTDTQTDK